ncbi:Elongation factor 4 [Mesoplasma sp. JKS002658]|uniref:translation elongation factor 4 n=1 Tax=Mesoplasma whartonense TaxID=2878854 RepID=UPI002022AB0E|nr:MULTISPECIES: translation elongation factor 4 [unclassified Mesoplasma]MCL8211561.1 Elongation factor 4 [Mesoplasma sp. JKS002664]MCL8212021.1 Elongation factor 4 [Mesoplasma sp. JKS002662]MCL8213740.1 Elongation factor 4 [Mesoplasma sp. JKS002660]MCL8213874.1 Elongation factor 4 [Mesoplasma sp. JKS002658]MCL8214840.1 Elongation factor 4 [Mesoplasma sp. JKS002663]
MDKTKIRNFSIIAHIDHGKSTLADRILELTKTVESREMQAQILDSMAIERERGITIKLNSVQLKYQAKNDEEYVFNLIDTPGHVDFQYEVSRSLAACEGAILVVDATQGVEAQTLANVYLALDNNLEIIPVINKVDLPSADVEQTKAQIEKMIGLDCSDAPLISAKTGLNVDQVLEAIVAKIPYPADAVDSEPLRALIFDSYYDQYLGVVMSIRVRQGVVKVGDKIKMMNTNAEYEVTEVGIKTPKILKTSHLSAGAVGWISASIKTIKDVHVGDTITSAVHPALTPLPGYKKLKPMVYSGIYPIDNAKYTDFKEALEKIELSDSSLIYEPETSQALGFGFRVGFLGLLHMEVIQERLEREYNLNLIATTPSVNYQITLTNNEVIEIDNPSLFPEVQKIKVIEEPYVNLKIATPQEYVGDLMNLVQAKLGVYKDLIYVDETRMELVYDMPLAEIIFDFFNKLKSISKGYASFEYELIGYQPSKLVKMDVLLNGEVVDALSMIVNTKFAYERGRELTKKLKEIIPRQNFEIPIQAAIGNKVIARETIKAYRKDVTWKLHAADISRKKKLLEKQKEGKKRMKQIGNVEVPQEAFIAVLKLED